MGIYISGESGSLGRARLAGAWGMSRQELGLECA